VEINHELDNIPSMEEVNKAIKQMSSGKAPGSDGSLQRRTCHAAETHTALSVNLE